jgi:hypothetical protein
MTQLTSSLRPAAHLRQEHARRLDAIGHVVDALHDFLTRHQAKDSCRNQVLWLSASSP